jgi:hypothetical protein
MRTEESSIPNRESHMHSKDLTIGVLSTTAVILLVGLILLHAQPERVYASGMGARGGDYIVVTGAIWEQSEFLYVFDASEQKLMVYAFDVQRDQVIPSGPADLSNTFSGRASHPHPAGGKKRSRRNRP